MNDIYMRETIKTLMQRYGFTEYNFDKPTVEKIELAMKHSYLIAFGEGEKSVTKNI